MTVAVVKFDAFPDSLIEAVELCNGFERLQSSDRVLLKPNITFCGRMPPYGMVTTSRVVDGVIRLLLERGCRDIRIGEGSIEVVGSSTGRGYKWTGIERVARKHGVKLVDMNRGPFATVDLGGVRVRVSRTALEADFLINMPVLKTHGQTKVSLGMKNLKGCLSTASRSKSHSRNRLDHLICHLNKAIRSDLTIIDGTYMLEAGPDTLLGTAHRKDLIIAGQDVFACDVIGSTILGVDPSQVGYLREYAEMIGRSVDVNTIDIAGEDLAGLKEDLDWKVDVSRELFAPAGVTGFSVPYPGDTLCSRCYATLAFALLVFAADNPGRDFGGVELCCGQEAKPSNNARKVFLYGDCALRGNKNTPDACRIQGCPPGLVGTLFALSNTLLSKPRVVRVMLPRMTKLIGIRLGVYDQHCAKWERYHSGLFDRNHFR